MESVGLYSEARNEYMKQLCAWIVPPLVDFFRVEYNALVKTHGKKTMSAFQTFCTEVPKWNQDVIETHINSVLDGCRCDYVEELMTAVFVAHTKMLTAIRTNGKQKKLQITLPKLDHFLHRVFTECARSLWKAPFLFATELSSVERQKNVLQAEAMCSEAMNAAVRGLLPVKNILREYLDDEEDVEDKKSEETKAPDVLDLVEDAAAEDEEKEEDEKEEKTAEKPEKPEKPVPVTPQTTPEPGSSTVDAAPSPKAVKPPKPSLLLTKVETPPDFATPVGSEHIIALPVMDAGVTVEKSPPVEPSGVPAHLTIETEPAVHFTPYDTVFQDTSGQSTIEYAPKVSVEDKPPSTWGLDEDAGPSLTIHESSSSIGGDEVEDLEAPPAAKAEAEADAEEQVDIDAPLASTSDFEELS
jgi:hypothetical protein